MKEKEQFVIMYEPNLTYFTMMTPIGPAYGGTLDEAERFGSREEAIYMMSRHWSFGSAALFTLSEAEALEAKGANP